MSLRNTETIEQAEAWAKVVLDKVKAIAKESKVPVSKNDDALAAVAGVKTYLRLFKQLTIFNAMEHKLLAELSAASYLMAAFSKGYPLGPDYLSSNQIQKVLGPR